MPGAGPGVSWLVGLDYACVELEPLFCSGFDERAGIGSRYGVSSCGLFGVWVDYDCVGVRLCDGLEFVVLEHGDDELVGCLLVGCLGGVVELWVPVLEGGGVGLHLDVGEVFADGLAFGHVLSGLPLDHVACVVEPAFAFALQRYEFIS